RIVRILNREVVESPLRGDFLRREGHAEVEIEVVRERRQPFEGPPHPSAIGLELGKGRAREGHHRAITMIEMNDRAVEAVGPVRAVRATGVPGRIEHEVVDDQLTSSVEEVAERFTTVRAVKDIRLRDFFPWELTTSLAQFVAQPREFLFHRQERRAGLEPAVVRDNAMMVEAGHVIWHGESSRTKGPAKA